MLENRDRSVQTGILAEILGTAESRQVIIRVSSALLKAWAGDKKLRGKVSGFLESRLEKQLTQQQTVELASLFNDPAFIQSLVEALLTAVKSANRQCPDWTESVLLELIEQTDFGELREGLEASKDSLLRILKSGSEALWRYPAKLVILLSIVPFGVNLLVEGLKDVVADFNQAPPDLVSDILLSLANDIDTESLSQALNDIFELIHKIETGSALIGTPGRPKLVEALTRIVTSVQENLDDATIHKARLSLLQDRSRLAAHRFQLVADDPERLHRYISYRSRRRSLQLTTFNSKLANILDLPDEAFEKWVADSIQSLDLQALSDLLEHLTQLLERCSDRESEAIDRFLEMVAHQIDPLLLQEGLSHLSSMLGKHLDLFGRALVPGIVTGICKALAPRDDEFEEQAAEARKALRALILQEEASL